MNISEYDKGAEKLVATMIAVILAATVVTVYVTLNSQPIPEVKCFDPDTLARVPCEDE